MNLIHLTSISLYIYIHIKTSINEDKYFSEECANFYNIYQHLSVDNLKYNDQILLHFSVSAII